MDNIKIIHFIVLFLNGFPSYSWLPVLFNRVAHGLQSSKRRKQVLVIKWLVFCEEAHDPFGQYPMTCPSNIWGKLKCQLL